MLLTELGDKIDLLRATLGNVKVKLEIGYFGGQGGGHNCSMEASVEDIVIKDNRIVLIGWKE